MVFKQDLVTIIVIAFCAIICGAKDYEDIEDFGNIRKQRLSKFLTLENRFSEQNNTRLRSRTGQNPRIFSGNANRLVV